MLTRGSTPHWEGQDELVRRIALLRIEAAHNERRGINDAAAHVPRELKVVERQKNYPLSGAIRADCTVRPFFPPFLINCLVYDP